MSKRKAKMSAGGYTTTVTPSNKITVSGAGSGYNNIVTVTGGGAGGGTGYTSSGSGIQWSVNPNPTNYSFTNTSGSTAITVSADGDIYQGARNDGKEGVFARLQRLETMLGILQRNRKLEKDYQPLADAGDEYDRLCDAAISRILDLTGGQLKKLANDYENMIQEAKVWRALTEETDV